MTKAVKLKELLRNNSQKNIQTNRLIYTPDNNSIEISLLDIGIDKAETSKKSLLVKTKDNLEWYPFMAYGEIYIVGKYTDNSKHMLHLNGKNGCVNGVKVLGKYAHLYGNEVLKIEGIPMTEELYKALPEHLRFENEFWLAEENKVLQGAYLKYCLKCVEQGEIKDETIWEWHGESRLVKHTVIALAKLPSNVIVIMENGNPLKIVS